MATSIKAYLHWNEDTGKYTLYGDDELDILYSNFDGDSGDKAFEINILKQIKFEILTKNVNATLKKEDIPQYNEN